MCQYHSARISVKMKDNDQKISRTPSGSIPFHTHPTSKTRKTPPDNSIGDASSSLLCWPPDGAGSATVSRRVLVIVRILVALRFVRFVRLVRLIRLYTEHHQIKRAIRQTVSQVGRIVECKIA